MKEFHFRRGTAAWPQGESLWHVYATPNLDQDTGLASLVAGCRAALTEWPLTIVEPAWLHITIAQISDAAGRTTSPDEIQSLRGELQQELRSIDPFKIMVGSALSYPSGVIFDLRPDDQLNRLRDTVANVIGRVRGPAAIEYNPGVLHLTLAYANGDADSDVIQRRLRRVRPSHAPMTIESVHLLEVTADPDAKTITWPTPFAEIFLGQDTRTAHHSDAEHSEQQPRPRLRRLRPPGTAAPQPSEPMSPPSLLGTRLPKDDPSKP